MAEKKSDSAVAPSFIQPVMRIDQGSPFSVTILGNNLPSLNSGNVKNHILVQIGSQQLDILTSGATTTAGGGSTSVGRIDLDMNLVNLPAGVSTTGTGGLVIEDGSLLTLTISLIDPTQPLPQPAAPTVNIPVLILPP